MAKKGETVFYTNGAGTFRAVVQSVHRDGSVTVKVMFPVSADGKDIPAYQGDIVRAGADVFRGAA
jgi:hypothetical protein